MFFLFVRKNLLSSKTLYNAFIFYQEECILNKLKRSKVSPKVVGSYHSWFTSFSGHQSSVIIQQNLIFKQLKRLSKGRLKSEICQSYMYIIPMGEFKTLNIKNGQK